MAVPDICAVRIQDYPSCVPHHAAYQPHEKKFQFFTRQIKEGAMAGAAYDCSRKVLVTQANSDTNTITNGRAYQTRPFLLKLF